MIDLDPSEIVLIDFGLSSKYMSTYMTHIPFISTKRIVGTPLYASTNAVLGKGNPLHLTSVEISRRDDIESLVYILIMCIKGTLPWKGILNLDFLNSQAAKYEVQALRNPNGSLCEGIDRKYISPYLLKPNSRKCCTTP
jgi:serine/threonine protein kinase